MELDVFSQREPAPGEALEDGRGKTHAVALQATRQPEHGPPKRPEEVHGRQGGVAQPRDRGDVRIEH